jgi:Site-specific recombinases, DNA invertase Pin homologs
VKAAIYARTAHHDSSTKEQIELCREYILEKGGEVVGIYDDPGTSAHQLLRDGLSLLLDDARKGKFDTLVLTSYDRLFRDSLKIEDFIDELEQLGISIITVKQL